MGMGMNANYTGAAKKDAPGGPGAEQPKLADAGSKKKEMVAGAEGFEAQDKKLQPDADQKKAGKGKAGG